MAVEVNRGWRRSTNLIGPEATRGAKIGFAFMFLIAGSTQELSFHLNGNQPVLVNLVVLIDPILDMERY